MSIKPPREFHSEIIIDPDNKWMFRGQEIIQENVLAYFKSNLFENEKGIYIYNVHGELAEKGYIESYGFPLFLVGWFENEDGTLYLTLDNEITYSVKEFDFYINDRGILFCRKEGERFIKIGISRPAYHFLGNFLEESDQGFYFQYKEIRKPIQNWDESLYVNSPYPVQN